MKPLVLLSSTMTAENQSTFSHNYVRAVSEFCLPAIAGGIDPKDVGAYADAFTGLILTGGLDIDPARYGQDAHEKSDVVYAEYDELDFALFNAFYKMDKPILGICRGIQVINVALGGTLIQHIPDMNGDVQHSGQEKDVDHRLVLEDSSFLSILGTEMQSVNSRHHQAIDRMGSGLHAAARADDDIIEAIQNDNGRIIGVQWHPERYEHPLSKRIFEYFASLCM